MSVNTVIEKRVDGRFTEEALAHTGSLSAVNPLCGESRRKISQHGIKTYSPNSARLDTSNYRSRNRLQIRRFTKKREHRRLAYSKVFSSGYARQGKSANLDSAYYEHISLNDMHFRKLLLMNIGALKAARAKTFDGFRAMV
jgi:hypothetical protein